MSSFNGWNIISLPAYPPPAHIEWQFDDIVAAARSPFSKQQEIYPFQRAQLRASLSYPTMENTTALPLLGFLAQLQGLSNIFLFGDPQLLGPQNPAAVAGSVSGSGQTGFSLVTTSSDLTPGDWFQLGLRLYRVVSVTGGTLSIWPNIRESPVDGTNLVITNTQGLFRLVNNKRKYSVKPGQIVEPITFEIEEAL